MKNKSLDINFIKVESYIRDKRPPVEIRSKLDFGFSFTKNAFVLFEVRPIYLSSDPNDYQKLPYAKFKYVKTQMVWKLYWMRASGKWQSYEPLPECSNVDTILKCIEEDAFGCFYG